jgi:hypothetical protein
VLDVLASIIEGFLREMHVIGQVTWIGMFGTKWAFLQLEN